MLRNEKRYVIDKMLRNEKCYVMKILRNEKLLP